MLTACGARSWLPVSDAGGPADAPAAGDGIVAPSCSGTLVPVLPNVPDLYFVLDSSQSMAQDDKWTNVRTVIGSLIFELGARARFGATVFPAPGGDQCAPGQEVMPLVLGDSLGQTENAFLQATALTPRGGTPTAATFQGLSDKFSGASVPSPRTTFLILATDGGPNCNSAPRATACPIDQCTRNIDSLPGCSAGVAPNCCAGTDPRGCLDGPATAAAISDLLGLGIRTYVLGIPGSAPYAGVLDMLATAGGTARASEPLYYRVDSTDTTALGSALGEIAAAVMKSCTLTLERPPSDPDRVNVYVDGTIVGHDGPDGWTLVDRTVTLEGGSCGAFQADAGAPRLQVIEGCPTVH
jgi:hypothetical protein